MGALEHLALALVEGVVGAHGEVPRALELGVGRGLADQAAEERGGAGGVGGGERGAAELEEEDGVGAERGAGGGVALLGVDQGEDRRGGAHVVAVGEQDQGLVWLLALVEHLDAQADGVAVVSAICSAVDPGQAAASLRKCVTEARS